MAYKPIVLAVADGGTGNSTLTNHGILVGSGTSAISQLVAGTAGQVLQSGGAAANPAYSTATYPLTTTVNQILYSSSANTVTGLSTANSAILNTSAGGVPSLATSPSCSGTFTAGTGLTATTGAITATAGNVVVTAGNLTLPNTNAGASNGAITLGGATFISNFGSANTFLGGAGNTTLTATNSVGVGSLCLTALTSGITNTAVGQTCANALTSGAQNIVVGTLALNTCITGSSNVAIGYAALELYTSSNGVAVGYGALSNISSGVRNTAIGYTALENAATGTDNTAFGYHAGLNYTTTDSNNISIGSTVIGTTGESNTTRIGNGSVSSCFITGISGATVVGTAVLCSAAGQLGTISSSIRYKENVKNMSDEISILHLRPVEFNYISDEKKYKKYGLIAEEIDKDFPYLCFYNSDSQPESVHYEELPIFLLKEIQRLNKRIEILEKNK